MRNARQVTLDAQFGRDIEWLRYEFRPSALGTRDASFVPVKVVAPGGAEVTLLILAVDLYVLGWRNAHGEFHLSDHPEAPNANSVSFSSHYHDLGVFKPVAPISAYGIYAAVRALGSAQTLGEANQLRVQVGLMALTVAESLRQDIVAGLMESLFAGRTDGGGLQRDLVQHYANNYGKQWKAGDPYVELPLHHDPAARRR